MLGFTTRQSADDQRKHMKELLLKTPEKLHPHLDCAYSWVTNNAFDDARHYNTYEGWKYLLLLNPPPNKIVDNKCNKELPRVVLKKHVYKRQPCKEPSCGICRKRLAGNICEKIKFCKVICSCETLWCHQECVKKIIQDQYNSQCLICKEYFIVSSYCSDIRSTIVEKI